MTVGAEFVYFDDEKTQNSPAPPLFIVLEYMLSLSEINRRIIYTKLMHHEFSQQEIAVMTKSNQRKVSRTLAAAKHNCAAEIAELMGRGGDNRGGTGGLSIDVINKSLSQACEIKPEDVQKAKECLRHLLRIISTLPCTSCRFCDSGGYCARRMLAGRDKAHACQEFEEVEKGTVRGT